MCFLNHNLYFNANDPKIFLNASLPMPTEEHVQMSANDASSDPPQKTTVGQQQWCAVIN